MKKKRISLLKMRTKKMSKLFYYHGAMSSSKSLDLLRTSFNYTEGGKKVLLMTSATDDRSGKGVISSRAGLSAEAYPIERNEDVYSNLMQIASKMSVIDLKEVEKARKQSEFDSIDALFHDFYAPIADIDVILVDEGQFLTRFTVESLARVVDELGIPVIVYALKNDFMNNLFEGSEALLLYADSIKEIKSICRLCGSKATMNLKVIDGEPVYQGEEQIEIGGNELYVPVCRHHYNNYNEDVK